MSAPSGLHALAEALRSGGVTPTAYADEVCARIEQENARVLALLPEPDRRGRLQQEAFELERIFPDPAARPPLYGVPVAVKDIFNVDGFVTRGGSALPPELFEGAEATSVARLREAGALIIGKAVTTEFAYFEPGATRNPRNLAHTPGGSSSGSAAAVAAEFAPLALGSQTVGSVIRPAAFCGVAGFKPSYGRIPTDGVIAYSQSVDHVGAFARDAAGLSLVASVLLDGWGAVAHASQAGRQPVIGVPDGPYLAQASDEGLEAFERQLAALELEGYDVRRVAAFEDIEGLNKRHRDLATAEFAQVHERWFAEWGALYRPRSAALVEAGWLISGEEVEAGVVSVAGLHHELAELMDSHGLDLWASPPATGPAPEGFTSTGNPTMNLPWTHAGMPVVTLPAGVAETGLPLGLQLSARFMADEHLLAWAETVEPVVAAL
jgi:Asp-tRNA(Asn)/Glu-tRNA(Gln) amidotransferase A subunit family amidase